MTPSFRPISSSREQEPDGFSGQSWITFRQALALGGHTRRGERGTTMVFADRFIRDAEHERARERGDNPLRDDGRAIVRRERRVQGGRLKLPRFREVFESLCDYGSVGTASIAVSYAMGDR